MPVLELIDAVCNADRVVGQQRAHGIAQQGGVAPSLLAKRVFS